MIAVLCVSTMFFGIGIVGIFFKGLAWEWQKFSNDMKGQVSEKPNNWETTTTIAGICSIILGIVLILWGSSVS
jgi:hypothetical protein